MSTPSAEDVTIRPPPDDETGAPTRLDADPARPPPGSSSVELADATVIVDDRVTTLTGGEARAATVFNAEDAATLLDAKNGARPPPRSRPNTTPALAASFASAGSGAALGRAPEKDHPAANVRYVLEALAGRGGMGTVHVARDIELLRRVALKQLSAETANDPAARLRFVREVQVTAQLDHPHIVPVYSLEVASGGRPAYAMKLVEGQTFGRLIADTCAAHLAGHQPDEDHALPARLEHFLKVCDAIAYAHERGVVHRDLKPANLMLGRHKEVYVMDWGVCRVMAQPLPDDLAPSPAAAGPPAGPGRTGPISRAQASIEASHGETAFGTIVGTPLYMSPEQAHGRHAELDARSDQCALGLILFELVTLRRPIGGKTVVEVLQHAGAGAREPLVHAFGAPIPGELGAIITKASASAPADRYGSVDEFGHDLRRFLRGDAVLARPDSLWQRGVRALGQHRQATALTLLGLMVAGVVSTGGQLWLTERARGIEERRQHRIERLVHDVAEQGDILELSFLEIQNALDMAVAAIGQALEYGQPSTAAVLWDGAATDATIGFDTAPGVSRARVEGDARRLVQARAAVRRVILAVRANLGTGGSAAAAGHPVDAADSGLHELRAGFETGLKFTVPAAALTRTLPDIRTAAWYRAAGDQAQFHWALVNHDTDAESELAISAPIVGEGGRRLGAAGLVVALDHVLANVVAAHPVANATRTFILAPDGTVIGSHITGGGRGDASDPSLPIAQIAAATRMHASFIEISYAGATHIFAFDTIEPVNWTLVSVVETSALAAGR